MAEEETKPQETMTAENAPLIDSEEELEAVLKASGGIPEEGDTKGGGTPPDDGTGEGEGADTGEGAAPDVTSEGEGEGGDTPAKEGDEPAGPRTDNTILYMKDRFKIEAIKEENIPEDMTREQELEWVGDWYERLAQQFNNRISQYDQLQELLKDEEVVEVLAAKQKGQTLADIARQYAADPRTLEDEVVIRRDLETTYKNIESEEERKELIESVIDGYKDKGILEKMAGISRKKFEAQETARKESEKLQAEEAAKQQEQQWKENVESFKNYLGTVNDVYGVKVSDDMKQEIFTAATRPDKDGLTLLDRALQSNDGILLATMGLVQLKRLLGAKGTVDTNKQNKRLFDRLLSDPDKLQSGGTTGAKEQEFDPAIANRF